MNHIASLESKYFNKIISNKKTIESRWSVRRRAPYRKVSIGDIVYLKESGKKVTHKAKVKKVIFEENLTQKKTKWLLRKFGKKIGVDISYFKKVKDKKYCSLIFLKDVNEIKPFSIKRSYGKAWYINPKIK